MSAAVAAAAAIALVSSAFAFGGMLEVLGSEDNRRSFMHRFFRGGGHFFWRFFRLAIMACIAALLAAGAVTALMTALTKPLAEAEWEPGWYLGSAATVAVVLLTVALFLLALDYARVRVARDDSRRMLRAYASGLGFVLRRLVATYGIAIAFLTVETGLVVLYLAYETHAPAAGAWSTIAVLVLLQQVVVLGRVFVRIAMVAAERHFHMTVLPTPVPVVAADPLPLVATVPFLATPPQDEQIPT
jgi:hypothetical protein